MRFLLFLMLLAGPAQANPYPLDAIPEKRLWHVTQIAGTPLPEGVEVNFTRLKEGVLGGQSGCNRFTMRIGQSPTQLYPGPVMTTRMMCDAAKMHAEAAFIEAMGKLYFLREAEGVLTLLAADGAVLLQAER